MKYGRDIRNGIVNEVDDEYIRQLDEYLAAADSNLRPILADLRNSLFNGEDVTSDSNKNTVNRDALNITDKQAEKLQKGYKKSRANWHASFNTDTHRINEAIQYWNNFKYQKPTEATPIEEKKKLIRGSNGQGFQYELDESGNKKYRSIMNQDEEDIYNAVWDYLMSSDEDKSKYDVSNWSNIDNLSNWYAKTFRDKEAAEEYRKRLFELIKSGERLTGDDRDILDLMQIGYQTSNEEAKQVAEQTEQSDKDKAWESFNVGNIWDSSLRDKQIVYDPNTKTYDIDAQYLPNISGSYGYLFDDAFTKTHYGYDWLNGYVNMNNKWYKASDLYNPEAELYKMLNHPQYDYFNKNKRGELNEADKVLKTHWYGTDFTKASNNKDKLGSFYTHDNVFYENFNHALPGATWNGNALDGYNVVRYYDVEGKDTDKLGRHSNLYTILDAYGNPVVLDGHILDKNGIPTYDYSKFSGLYDPSYDAQKQGITYYDRTSNDESDLQYYNRYTLPGVGIEDKTIVEGWMDPTTRKVHVSIAPEWGGTEGFVFGDMPEDVYKLLSDKYFVSTINDDRSYLLPRIKNLIQNKTLGKKLKADDILNIVQTILNKDNDPSNDKNALTIATSLVDYFKNYWNSKPTPIKRPNVQSNKKGGVIKHQYGGPVRNVEARRLDNAKIEYLTGKMNNPTVSKTIGDGTGLSPTDRAELTALSLDALGAIAGFIPGIGDGVTIAAGQAANAIQAGVDRQRVKDGTYGKGRAFGNWVFNTGLDVASVVPIIGDAANTANSVKKWINFFKRSGQVVGTILAGAGFTNAAILVGQLASGKKNDLKIEDLRVLLGGLVGAGAISKQILSRVANVKVLNKILDQKAPLKHEFKFKNGDADVNITLSDDAVARISKTKGRNNIDSAFKDEIKAEANSKGITLSDEQLNNLISAAHIRNANFSENRYGRGRRDTIEPKKQESSTIGFLDKNLKDRMNSLNSSEQTRLTELLNSGSLNRNQTSAATRISIANDMPGIKKGNFFTQERYKSDSNNPETTPQRDTKVPNNRQSEVSNDTSNPAIRPISDEEIQAKFTQYEQFIKGNNTSNPSTFRQQLESRVGEIKELLDNGRKDQVKDLLDDVINTRSKTGKKKTHSSKKQKLIDELNTFKSVHSFEFKHGGTLKYNDGGELDAAVITAERSPKMSFTPVQIDWGKINSGVEKINPYQKKKSNGFVQYSSYLNQEESAIDKAKTSLDELVNSDEFKKIRITNPELAKLMFDRAVENIAFNSNDDAFKSQLQTEANSYRRSFKTGGVLKAAGGMRTPEELKSWLDQMTSRIADSVTIDEPEITLPKFEFKKLSIPKINLPKLRTRSELSALPKIEKLSSSNIIPKRKFVSTETSGLNVPKKWSSVIESKPIKATIGASPTAPISEISSIGKTERKNLLSKLRLNNSLPSESEARTNFLKRHNITIPTKPVLEEYVEPISDFSDKDRRNELRAERRYLRHSSSDLEQFLEEHGIEEPVKPTIPETSSDYMNDFEAFDENGKSLGIVPEESIANTIDPNSDLLAKHKYWTNMAKETVGNQPGESWWGRTLKALGGPEAINQSMSLGRLLHDIGTNDQLYDIQAKAAIDAANAQMQTNTPEYYSRKTINAGNALREKANREIQSLPPVNADYLKYAAVKQAITDQYNTDIAEATRLDSAQDSQNINTGIQEQRSYADMRSKIENANRAIQSGKMVALSQLAAAKTQANRQSIANYLLEKQTEFDKNRGIIDQANIADAKLEWTRDAQSGIEKDINAKFKAAYDAAGGSNTGYTIEQWVRSQPGYTKDLSEIMQKWQDWLALQESSYARNQVPGSSLYMKSGGKMRSAKDQININKHKAHDQNWVKSNESVRKAVSQLNKQAFEILMKLLS